MKKEIDVVNLQNEKNEGTEIKTLRFTNIELADDILIEIFPGYIVLKNEFTGLHCSICKYRHDANVSMSIETFKSIVIKLLSLNEI